MLMFSLTRTTLFQPNIYQLFRLEVGPEHVDATLEAPGGDNVNLLAVQGDGGPGQRAQIIPSGAVSEGYGPVEIPRFDAIYLRGLQSAAASGRK